MTTHSETVQEFWGTSPMNGVILTAPIIGVVLGPVADFFQWSTIRMGEHLTPRTRCRRD